MLVLAIDTALAACSAAVLDTAQGAIVARESVPMARGQAELLLPMIARVMDRAGVEFAELDRLAVTVGPGSFTGLRVGISAARGIALAAGKPAVAVTTLAAYAAPHLAADNRLPLIAAIDARHAHVYVQAFGPGGRALGNPHIASLEDAGRASGGGAVRLAGSGAELVAAEWPSGSEPPLLVDAPAAPEIDWVARLGAAVAEVETAPKPLYLRAAEAQPQHAGVLPRR